MTSLKKLAFRGAIWTLFGFGTIQVLRFGNNLILTRLLVPEYFGLMALVVTFRTALELFSDVGLGQNIVNSKRGDESSFLNTAWTIRVVRGFVIFLVCIPLSVPITNFYNDQRLLWLIPIVLLSSVIDGFSSTSVHTLHRRMDLGKYSVYEIILQVLYSATLIVLAWLYPTIWTLAIGTLIGSVYKVVGSYWLIPGSFNRFEWDKEAVKEILSFGKWMFVSSALMFAADQVDRLVLAKIFSFQILGVYTVAYTLAAIPKEVVRQLSHRVIFPTISQQADLPWSSLRMKILRQRRLILLVFALALASLVTIGDLFVATLYDKRYDEATWMMPILCVGLWFSILFYSMYPALLAIRKPIYSALSNFARFVFILVGVPLAHQNFGMLGAIIVISFSDLPLYMVNLYGLWREKLSCIVQDIQTTAFFIAILALFLVIRHSLGFGIPIQTLMQVASFSNSIG